MRGLRGSVLLLGTLVLWQTRGDVRVRAEVPAPPQAVSRFSYFEGFAPSGYLLDPLPRFVEEGARVRCEADQMVVYRSRSLRYAVRVHPAFVMRLERFEQLVRQRAVARYGRAPRRLIHKGAFSCRRARHRRQRISEHALGNALDLQGFDFGPLRRGEPSPPGLPKRLRRGFRLRVISHWGPRRARDRYHARFLHELVEAIHQRPDIFRGIVGPPRPRHRDHLHLDAAPWRYAMYAYDHAQQEEQP